MTTDHNDGETVMMVDQGAPTPVAFVGPDAWAAAHRYAALLYPHRDAIRAQSAARSKRDRLFSDRAKLAGG